MYNAMLPLVSAKEIITAALSSRKESHKQSGKTKKGLVAALLECAKIAGTLGCLEKIDVLRSVEE